MNKHIITSLAKYDFNYEKNYGYGHIDGYEVNVFNNPMGQGPIFVVSTYLSQSKKNDFIVKMNAHKYSLVQVTAFDFGVMIMIGAMTAKSFEKKFPDVMSSILSDLESLEAPKSDICPQSGEAIDEADCRLITLPNTKIRIRLSNKAITTVNSNIEKINEDYKKAPNNYLKGFGGIMIGAIAGVTVTIIMSLLGFITSIAPLVSILFGIFLYKKFGGKPNHVMIIMSFVTTLVMILGAIVLMYISAANVAVQEAGLELRGLDSLSYCLNNLPEFKKSFYLDLALSGLFILLAEGLSIYRLIRMIQRPKNIQ